MSFLAQDVRKLHQSNRRVSGSLLFFAVTLVFVFMTIAHGQLPTAAVSGFVRDSSGAVIPGATVTATSRETGLTRTIQTGADGHYILGALPVGVYDVKAEAVSFKPEVQQGLNLAVGQEAVLNFSMTLGAVAEAVTVTAEAPLVNTTSGSLGGLVDEQRVTELPLNGRSFSNLILLEPGISIHKPASPTSQLANGLVFSSNGAPYRSNFIMMDGANLLSGADFGGVSVTGSLLGIDGIREFRVITNAFPAEYGMTMGSQMTVVSKGGTNELHGSVFEFLRNSALDARNFFDRQLHPNDPRLPAFRRNNFGAAVGGPVRKDKSFFFVNYEGVRQSQGNTQVLATPTLAARQDGAVVGGVVVPKIADNVKPYLALYPLPTEPLPTDPTGASGVGRFSYAFVSPTREDFGQARFDQNFSDRDNAFIRYTIIDSYVANPVDFPQFPDVGGSRGQYLTLAENHTFSPTLLNVFRLSYSRSYQARVGPSPLSLGFLPGRPFGSINPGSGVSSIGPDGSRPSVSNQDVYTLSSDVFLTRGAHSLKFGTLMNRYNLYRVTSTNLHGSYTFSTLADFLQGNPRQLSILAPNAAATDMNLRWYTFGFYAQDDWRAAPRLTLNVGLRYEINTTVNNTHGDGSSLSDVLHGAAFTLAQPLYKNPSLGNFGPRFGFAWDVLGDNKTSLRGGFAVLYDIANTSNAAALSPPFTVRVNLTSGLTFPVTVITPGTAGARAVEMMDYNLAQPHMLQYNLTLERQLPGNTVLSVGYVGSRGINILQVKDVNAPLPEILPNGEEFWTGTEPRPNPNWDNITFHTAASDSRYSSLQVGFQKRLSHGLQFQNSYTWATLLDNTQSQAGGEGGGSNPTGVDPNHPPTDRGPADFYVRHNWTLNLLYEVPTPKKALLGKTLGGWRLGSILTLRSGLPFTPYLSGNQSRSNVSGGSNPDRPNLNPGRTPADITQGTTAGCPGVQAGQKLGGPNLYFDPCAFSIQPLGFLGTASRNLLLGPPSKNWDFSLTKDIPLSALREGTQLEFRAEIFNLLNRPNFNTVINGRTVFTADGTKSSPVALATAGQLDRTVSSSRQIQLALKLIF